MPDHALALLRRDMAAFADRRGLALAGVATDDGSQPALAEVVGALRRRGGRGLLVPTLEHLAHFPAPSGPSPS